MDTLLPAAPPSASASTTYPSPSTRGISPPTQSSPSPSISIAPVFPAPAPEAAAGLSLSPSPPNVDRGSGVGAGIVARCAEFELGTTAKPKKIITPKPSTISQSVSEFGPSSHSSSSSIAVASTTATPTQTPVPTPTLPIPTNVRVIIFFVAKSGSDRCNRLFLNTLRDCSQLGFVCCNRMVLRSNGDVLIMRNLFMICHGLLVPGSHAKQATPPTLREILHAYTLHNDESKDRGMLLGVLRAKSAEDHVRPLYISTSYR